MCMCMWVVEMPVEGGSIIYRLIMELTVEHTILCLYSSEAEEIATSQLFCKLAVFDGFKRQNL